MPPTIGLNDGPYLVMTIALENQCLILEDRLEARIPRLVISPKDTIAIAEFLTTGHNFINNPEIQYLASLTVPSNAYGSRFNIVFEQTTTGHNCTVVSSDFSVKAWFTTYAKLFFTLVLDATEYNHENELQH